MPAPRALALAIVATIGVSGVGAAVGPAAPGAAGGATRAPFDQAAFDSLLRRHVVDGTVDYHGMKRDSAALERYCARLATADTTGRPRAEQLAFWIDAYNALTLLTVVRAYPIASIRDLGNRSPISIPGDIAWKTPHRVAGGSHSLNEIEAGILRTRFADPRVHFAINCASKSCPPLDSRAFTASDLDARLDAAARRFLDDPHFNRFDDAKGEWHLSAIFEWYHRDFELAAGSVPAFIQRYRGASAAGSAGGTGATAGAAARAPRITYLPYDWSLNGR